MSALPPAENNLGLLPAGLKEAGRAPIGAKPEPVDLAESPQVYATYLDSTIEVHSHIALESSRTYCTTVLASITEVHPRTCLAVKLAEQEIALQESIRKRSFDDGEQFTLTRRWLAKAFWVLFGMVTVGTMVILNNTGVSEAVRQESLGLLKYVLGIGVPIMLGFYFNTAETSDQQRKSKKRGA